MPESYASNKGSLANGEDTFLSSIAPKSGAGRFGFSFAAFITQSAVESMEWLTQTAVYGLWVEG